VLVIKYLSYESIAGNTLLGIYSLAISVYILSRFALAYFYEPKLPALKDGFEPTVSFCVPSKNEGEHIRKTILRIADTDYPKDKFNIIVLDDGSTDNTLAEMFAAKSIAEKKGVSVFIASFERNRGKREGMALCVKRSLHEILIFIDSDSFVENNTARELVKYFTDQKVAAVAGHTFVANAEENFLTKMESIRYFVSFRAYKASEALFNSVMCCSGCCSAYRKSAVSEVLEPWLKQKFLGVTCTYGDDRSLTNFLLRQGYKTMYAPEAICHTIVPNTLKKLMRQQLRWKKSWFRENLIASTFIWKKHPILSISFYLGFILPLLAPFVVVRAFIWYPYVTGNVPWFYILGMTTTALICGLFYHIKTLNGKWFYGVLFSIVFTLTFIWQLPWAIINLRDNRWGTR